jgi:hypothetical protein
MLCHCHSFVYWTLLSSLVTFLLKKLFCLTKTIKCFNFKSSQFIHTPSTACALFGKIQTQTAVPPANCCFSSDFKPSLKMTNICHPLVYCKFFTLLHPCPHGMFGFGMLLGYIEAIDNSLLAKSRKPHSKMKRQQCYWLVIGSCRDPLQPQFHSKYQLQFL